MAQQSWPISYLDYTHIRGYEGRTTEGKPLPDVIWIAFGRYWYGPCRFLEGACKDLGVPLVASEEVLNAVSVEFPDIQQKAVEVRGG